MAIRIHERHQNAAREIVHRAIETTERPEMLAVNLSRHVAAGLARADAEAGVELDSMRGLLERVAANPDDVHGMLGREIDALLQRGRR